MSAITLKRQPVILVADDSRSARELIKNFLENDGYSVTLAADGKEAVKKFRERHHDLVLMDANMPVVDGYRACAEIRRGPTGKDVSIIMITGQNDDESVEQAFAAGAEEFVTKPIHWSVLQKRIRLSLNSRFAQEEVLESRARMEAVFNTAADSIIVINAAGIMESVNRAAEKLFGYAQSEMVGQNVSMLMPSPYRERHDSYIASYVHTGKAKVMGQRMELVALKKSGKTFPIELTISEVKLTDRILFTGILRDITERKEAEQKIFYQANYDALTGIANRSLFMKNLRHHLAESAGKGQGLSLLFIDLDRFKWVNDNLGHAAGDELLKLSSERIQSCLREGDLAARLGGDEFTVILPNIERQQAVAIAHLILHRLNEEFSLTGKPAYISGSLGVAFYPEDAQELDALLKCADEAMYCSKRAGRNACHLSTGESLILPRKY
ncbi:two-component system response regulator [Candidatus Magnetaquicoccus inordinatus]|uniref:two-component system response regulator n=1 Tax=Candidatus Magnetaquicoccus inordinatus TaxID=2496818 RepID=UPI00102B1259|nr:diguanylate cyclase [Candidatus Magnetaquicoccus inordinatus]